MMYAVLWELMIADIQWVTLFFRNTKVLHQTTGLTPN